LQQLLKKLLTALLASMLAMPTTAVLAATEQEYNEPDYIIALSLRITVVYPDGSVESFTSKTRGLRRRLR